MPDYFGYERTWLSYLENLKMQLQARPLVLGGVSGSGGGGGGPVGGFVGQLPQTSVAYDTDEFAFITTPVSGSLLDNLNHIRYRLNTLEESTSGIGTGMISVKDDGSTISSEITVLDFIGPVATSTVAGTATITTTDKRNLIRMWDHSANTFVYYDATTAGLTSACAALGAYDVIYLPSHVAFTGVELVINAPGDVAIIGETTSRGASGANPGPSLQNSAGNPVITSQNAYSITLKNLRITSIADKAAASVCIAAKGHYMLLENVMLIAGNDVGPNYVITSGEQVQCNGGNWFRGWGLTNSKHPFYPSTSVPQGIYSVDYPTLMASTTVVNRLVAGQYPNYLDVDSAGKTTFAGTAQLNIPYKTTDVSNPPTDAELDAALGTPATVGSGYLALLNDAGGGTNEYLVTSDGTNWLYVALTKAT